MGWINTQYKLRTAGKIRLGVLGLVRWGAGSGEVGCWGFGSLGRQGFLHDINLRGLEVLPQLDAMPHLAKTMWHRANKV